jgi:tRNA threonylcarbamoyladenosine biosynthesis protein TsaB
VLEQSTEVFILSIETSQKVCSAAIHKNGEIIASQALFNEKSASGLLTPIIEQLLKNCNLKPADLLAVAVAKGPGSYTGLRIAVSTAKGLCFAIDKPLIAVNTLEAMALQINNYFPNDYLFCPMLDARRMEVYCAIYSHQMEVLEDTNAKVIDESSFSELLSEKSVVFFGDGAAKCNETLGNNSNAIFLENQIFPSAETVGKLAFKSYKKGQFENLVTFEPFYLKDFIGNVK